MSTGAEGPGRSLADVEIGVLADAFVSRLTEGRGGGKPLLALELL